MTTRRLTITLTVFLETHEGERPSDGDMEGARHDTMDAIRYRLMGEGYLADEVMLAEYTLEGYYE